MIGMADFDLDAAVAAMPEAHLHCRDYGHSWKAHTARYLPAERYYEQTLRCTRCRTMRRRVLSERGEVIGSSYTYPEHYQLKGVGHLDGDARATVRLASLGADLQRAGSNAA